MSEEDASRQALVSVTSCVNACHHCHPLKTDADWGAQRWELGTEPRPWIVARPQRSATPVPEAGGCLHARSRRRSSGWPCSRLDSRPWLESGYLRQNKLWAKLCQAASSPEAAGGLGGCRQSSSRPPDDPVAASGRPISSPQSMASSSSSPVPIRHPPQPLCVCPPRFNTR